MSNPQPGDVLTTPEQMDACPTGTIVRSNLQVVAVAENAGQVRPWAVVGDTSPRESGDLLIRGGWGTEWEVIWVPPVTRVEFEAVVQDFGCAEVVRPCFMRGDLGGGPWTDLAPLVGDRVRVTVEKIGPDHE